MTPVDLTPAARRLSALVANVPDDALTGPTPCPDYSLGDLIDHIGGLALAFTAAARKEIGGDSAQGPSGDAARLGDDWHVRIPEQLAALAEAWRDPAAWTGMTQAGGVDLPGEIGGLVALDEIVIHGWDVAARVPNPMSASRNSSTRCTSSSPASPRPRLRTNAATCSDRSCTFPPTRHSSTASSAWPAATPLGHPRNQRRLTPLETALEPERRVWSSASPMTLRSRRARVSPPTRRLAP